MKIAIPVWNERVSPVFDVAEKILITDVESGIEKARSEYQLKSTNPAARATEITNLGIDVLICGAISRPLEAMITASGVGVIARVCGNVDEILRAYIAGRLLTSQRYLMPGCWRRGYQWRGRRRFGKLHKRNIRRT